MTYPERSVYHNYLGELRLFRLLRRRGKSADTAFAQVVVFTPPYTHGGDLYINPLGELRLFRFVVNSTVFLRSNSDP